MRSFLLAAGIIVAATTTAACATILDFQDARDDLEQPIIAAGPDDDDAGSATANQDAATSSASLLDAHIDSGGDKNDATPDVVSPPTNVCNGGSCIAPVPDGWNGPLALIQGVAGSLAMAPACTGDYDQAVYTGFAGPIAPAAECGCTCGPMTGATCATPVATYFKDKDCLVPCNIPSQSVPPNSCSTITSSSLLCSSIRMTMAIPAATGGSCVPTPSIQVPAASWATSVRLCGTSKTPQQSTCDTGNVCAAKPTVPFAASNRCIARAGSFACPAGYPSQRTYHEGASDSRTCTTCSCGTPNAACGGSMSAFNVGGGALSCNGTPTVTSMLPLACLSVGSLDVATTSNVVPTGSCAPVGGAPAGSFDPGPETTVCCLE